MTNKANDYKGTDGEYICDKLNDKIHQMTYVFQRNKKNTAKTTYKLSLFSML